MKVFTEEQRFLKFWIPLLATISIISLVLIIKDYNLERGMEGNIGLAVSILIIVATLVLLSFMKLTTRIDETGIYYRFSPFHLTDKFVPWNGIDKAFVRKYNPVLEYGGWGMKSFNLINRRRGVAYNVSGTLGLQIILKNGKKILIGTQKKEEVERILKTYQEKIRPDEK